MASQKATIIQFRKSLIFILSEFLLPLRIILQNETVAQNSLQSGTFLAASEPSLLSRDSFCRRLVLSATHESRKKHMEFKQAPHSSTNTVYLLKTNIFFSIYKRDQRKKEIFLRTAS
jgi:hypothetical protein